MSISITSDKMQRISITVPTGVLEKVKRLINDKSVSGFFTEAAAEKISREERSQAFQALLAAPATHTFVSDTSKYLRELRKEDAQRDARLGI
jgi:metal-responsive CopG/Arc/MetJ family transcriptional regulator